jgi:pimeloyl-ACP methyl ester carboxylesterase
MTESPAFSRIDAAAVSPVQILKLVLGALGATAVIGLTIEAIQSAAEYGRLVTDPVFAGANVARGDAHTVMVIPGFLGNDHYLETLRGWLRRIGYTPLASGLSRNTGFKREILEHLEQRALAAAQTSGSISLIGHSLGGVYARAIARRNPATVRQIVTLGSPLSLDNGPVPVPFTTIYSRADRIVRYPRALADDADAANVEAGGCHVGMAFNAAVYRAIAAALSAAAGARTASITLHERVQKDSNLGDLPVVMKDGQIVRNLDRQG